MYALLARVAAICCAASALGVTGTAAALECFAQRTGEKPHYDGPSASSVYDNRFKNSALRIPKLDAYVPQGLATWSNWQGKSDLLLVTSYKPSKADKSAIIIGIDPNTTEIVGAVEIRSDHAGGIAVFEKQGWAYVSSQSEAKPSTVAKYSLPKLKEMLVAARAHPNADLEFLRADDEQQVEAASFLTSHGPTDTLWLGSFTDKKVGHMDSYKLSDNGDLTRLPGRWEVPRKTQGAMVTKDFFVYSTSHGRTKRSNIYVVRRGEGEKDIQEARLFCFRAPTMAEGIARYGDDVYVAYESGAAFYNKPDDGEPHPINRINTLHKATLASLTELPPESGPTQ